MAKQFFIPKKGKQYILREDFFAVRGQDVHTWRLDRVNDQRYPNPPPILVFPMNTIFTVLNLEDSSVRIKLDESPNAELRIRNKWRVNIPIKTIEQWKVDEYVKP